MKSLKLLSFTPILCLMSLLVSCENKLADSLIPQSLYILESGEKQVSVLRSSSEYKYPVAINRSGLQGFEGTLKLIGGQSVLEEYNRLYETNYKLIPEDYFTLEQTSFTFNQNDLKNSTNLTLDVTKVKDFLPTNSTEYAIPLKLISEDETFNISEDKKYVLLIPRLVGGIREESGELLWERTLEQMGLEQTDDLTNCIAVTEKYLFVNTRKSDLSYFDRFTGEYIGRIQLPFKGNITNFNMASDGKNTVIISELRRGTSMQKQDFYRIDGTNDPVLFFQTTHTINNGRKLSIMGDLDGDAIICSVIEREPAFLYWRTVNGELVSTDPEIFQSDKAQFNWGYPADVQPLDYLDLSKGVYMTGHGLINSKFVFVDGETKNVLYEYDLKGGGIDISDNWATQSLDMMSFNGATYLAVGSVRQTQMNARLLHLDDPSGLSKDPLSSDLCKFITTFDTETNNQRTAEVLLATSNDGELMQMYVFATNGGVKVYQFDSKGD